MPPPKLPLPSVLSALREGVRRLFGTRRERPERREPAAGVPAPSGADGEAVEGEAVEGRAIEGEPVEDEEIELLVGLVRDRFGQLSPGTRDRIVHTVAGSLQGRPPVDDREDVLDTLEASVRDAGRARTVDTILTLREHVPTLDGLRGRYRRVPTFARGAVEKTAAGAVRAGGVPRQTASDAVRALLTMPEDDWAVLVGTLDEVASQFVAGAAET